MADRTRLSLHTGVNLTVLSYKSNVEKKIILYVAKCNLGEVKRKTMLASSTS